MGMNSSSSAFLHHNYLVTDVTQMKKNVHAEQGAVINFEAAHRNKTRRICSARPSFPRCAEALLSDS
jgi:hypothetical protein